MSFSIFVGVYIYIYECSYWYAHLNKYIMFNISSYDFIYTDKFIYNPDISGIDL